MADPEEIETNRAYVENQIFLMFADMDVLSNADLGGSAEYVGKINLKIAQIEAVMTAMDKNIKAIIKTLDSQNIEVKLAVIKDLLKEKQSENVKSNAKD